MAFGGVRGSDEEKSQRDEEDMAVVHRNKRSREEEEGTEFRAPVPACMHVFIYIC